ncbi:MAG: hypothetical protein JSS20_17410 [Proteobacteria bacterium]|nr:hypothetical protein [Pseudomonadota bacterium]
MITRATISPEALIICDAIDALLDAAREAEPLKARATIKALMKAVATLAERLDRMSARNKSWH